MVCQLVSGLALGASGYIGLAIIEHSYISPDPMH
jgi:hypothetical protein